MALFDRNKRREMSADILPEDAMQTGPVGVGAFARQPQAAVIDEALAEPVIDTDV